MRTPTPRIAANPFALMIDPQAVLQQVERSERLERLERHVCRPLDKPMLGRAQSASDDFDREVDAQEGADDNALDVA